MKKKIFANILAAFICLAPVFGKNALVLQADFGGVVMEGVAYSVSKDLDIFQNRPVLPLYDIRSAAIELGRTAPYWPPGTVFVSIVDPGVGTTRKSVVLKTKSGHFFVSPDNGTLSVVASNLGLEAVREIDESVNRLRGSGKSHTFHGRDVYSYTGARLASGVITFAEVGPLLEPRVMMLEDPKPVFKNGAVRGIIRSSGGRLGNVSSNIDNLTFDKLGIREREKTRVAISNGGRVVWEGVVPYARTFGDVFVGDPLLFVNSSYFMSLAINQGNFAETHGIGKGPGWTIVIRKP